MKRTRIAINGFGRMGRLNLRAAWGWPELDWALINEPKGGAASSAHLLNFDSVQGRWAHEARADGASAIVVESRGDAMGRSSIMNTLDGPAPSGPSRMIDRQHAADDTEVVPPGAVRTESKSRIAFTEYSKPGDVPWADHGVDIVLECSGRFRKPEDLHVYFERGVKKVIVAAPVKGGGALNLVMGVNDHLYDPARHHLLTNASCTTNCLAPLVKVIHEGIGIERGVITTIHDITNTQTLVDRPDKDLRRARAAGLSLIPTTTGSATAIGLIYPELLGKLNGHAVRVPLLGGSLTDCAFAVKRPTTVDEVNALLRSASEAGPLRGILGYEDRPLVSIDFKGDPRSAIIDAPSTMVVDGTLVKIYAWYDNEWGYCNRMMELTRKVAASL